MRLILIDIEDRLPKWSRLFLGYFSLSIGITILSVIEIIILIVDLAMQSIAMDQAIYEKMLMIDYYSDYDGDKALLDAGIGIILCIRSFSCDSTLFLSAI